MSMDPCISVAMGVFNGAAYLSETIGSVLCQTCRDFEFIVVNDGSTDPSVDEILAEYTARDLRVRVLHQANAGLTRALIADCAAARGRYIARIDAGDAIAPDRLTRQAAVLESHPEVGFVSCWTGYYGPAWEPLYVEKGPILPDAGMDVLPAAAGERLLAGPTCHPSVMFRRSLYEAVGGYRAEFYYGQDWDLWYRLAEKGRFAIVPDELYRVRLFPDSLSGRYHDRQQAIAREALEGSRCRRIGLSEAAPLARAAAIRPGPVVRRESRRSAFGSYFIGCLLFRNGDERCVPYLKAALGFDLIGLKARLRLMQWKARHGTTVSTKPQSAREIP